MRITKYLLALAALWSVMPALAQESNRFIDLPLEELAETWLDRNCGIDEERSLENAVAHHGRALQPIFLNAWREGAPERALRATREAASLRYQRERKLLDDASELRYRARTLDGLVTRAANNFDFGYRSQALRGLHFAGGVAGREIVEAAAADKGSPFNSIARVVLARRDAD